MRSALVALLVACGGPGQHIPPPPPPDYGSGSGAGSGSTATQTSADMPPPPSQYNGLLRADFNRLAVRANEPVYWIADTNRDGAIDPDEIAFLLFYGVPSDPWHLNGGLT